MAQNDPEAERLRRLQNNLENMLLEIDNGTYVE